MIVPAKVFVWFVTAVVVGFCVGGGARDVILLLRRRPTGDLLFGCVVGLLLAVFGVIGVLRYHLRG